ncbi:MAG: hypothetical protein GXP18_08895 [Gammaproteobacteria bacterium]|nr:hypothetical protein [Gammaproteobacteria bacterium]
MKKYNTKISDAGGFLVINTSFNYISRVMQQCGSLEHTRDKYSIVEYVCGLPVFKQAIQTKLRVTQ